MFELLKFIIAQCDVVYLCTVVLSMY